MKSVTSRGSLLIIFAVCVAVEIALIGADNGIWSTSRLRSLAYQYGGFWIGLLQDWRPNFASQPFAMFLTYSFLHAGLWHLAVNMVTLFSLGPLVISRVGQGRFAAIYLLATIGAACGFALLSQSPRPMVGASGALFGLAGALAAWDYVDRFVARAGLWPVVRLVAILVALNLILLWATGGQLAWQTHLGGFVSGWILALIIDPRSRPIEPEPED